MYGDGLEVVLSKLVNRYEFGGGGIIVNGEEM